MKITLNAKTVILSTLLLSLSACVSASTNENTLSDAQLINIAQQDSRKLV